MTQESADPSQESSRSQEPAQEPAHEPSQHHPDALLGAVHAADRAHREAEVGLSHAVLRAREAGRTWAQIGETLGVSRQAAFKRFGRPIDPETGRVLSTGPSIDADALAEQVMRALAAGDIDAVHGLMTHACSRTLSRARLGAVWRDVLASVGELESFSGHETRSHDGSAMPGVTTGPLVARLVLQHEAGEMVAHVSVNRSGRVDGLLLAPPAGEADLAF